MTKVALIQPGVGERFAVCEPLNLGSIASYLEKNGVDVRIIDQLAGQNVEKEIKKYSPDVVGITATTPLIMDAYKVADFCKSQGILTVMGGVHVSILPDEALKHADVVVKGEGERALLDLVKEGVKSGIVHRPFIENLDDIPPPARHLMRNEFYLRTKDRLLETYLQFVPSHTKTAQMVTSRGCPYSCIFCHNTWRDAPYRFNSAERVISEIEQLIEVYGVEAIFFVEDNLFVNKPRLKKICKLMKEKKISIIWGGNARVDNIDLESLQMVKEVGCKQITFGFESGSQRILDLLNKKTTVEQNIRAVNMCKTVGIAANGTVIIGNPTETMDDIEATRRFIKETPISSLGVCIATPFPGTELWNWCEQRGLIPKSFNWSDFTYDKAPLHACDTIPQEKILEIYDEMVSILPQKYEFSRYVGNRMRHPVRTMKYLIRHPRKSLRAVKKLKM
jgi:anaerobic magnesium-protoporphyrin IX monomethyl ester cyclase